MPKISVIMAAYNETTAQVDAAIASVIGQTETDFELIVVLDAPDNQSLLQTLTKWQQKEPRMRLLVNAKNMGLAKSLNRGIEAATAPWLARMDADDKAMPQRFARQLQLVRERQLAALSTNATFIDEADAVVGEHDWIPESPEALAQLLPLGSNLVHPSMLLDREAIQAVGGYRTLPTAEDYDLWLRLLKAGYAIGATNERLMQYRLRGNSMTQGDKYLVFLVSEYLREAYQRPQYPTASEQKQELTQWLQKHHAKDKKVQARFTNGINQLSAAKKAARGKDVKGLAQSVSFALAMPAVWRYAKASMKYANQYASLLANKEND